MERKRETKSDSSVAGCWFSSSAFVPMATDVASGKTNKKKYKQQLRVEVLFHKKKKKNPLYSKILINTNYNIRGPVLEVKSQSAKTTTELWCEASNSSFIKESTQHKNSSSSKILLPPSYIRTHIYTAIHIVVIYLFMHIWHYIINELVPGLF